MPKPVDGLGACYLRLADGTVHPLRVYDGGIGTDGNRMFCLFVSPDAGEVELTKGCGIEIDRLPGKSTAQLGMSQDADTGRMYAVPDPFAESAAE
jgi:hypothetical protein